MLKSIIVKANVALMKKKGNSSTANVKAVVPVSGRLVVKKSRPRRKMSEKAGVSKAKSDTLKMSPVCTNCRERHLKCSGPPLCTRCKNEGSQCIFVPSRRGKRPPKERTPTPDPQTASNSQPRWPRILPSSSSTNLSVPSAVAPIRPSRSPLSQVTTRSATPDRTLSHHFIDLAYQHDLSTNLFVLPKRHLLENIARTEIQCLKVVIEYIGMVYDPMNRSMYSAQIERILFAQQFAINAYTVQAYLLLAITLASRHDRRAAQCLHWTSTYALQIGMNKPTFPQLHSGGSREQEESWSSTWTVLSQLCQMWSVSLPSNSAASQTALMDVSSRRSSGALAPGQSQSHIEARRSSMPQIQNYAMMPLPEWYHGHPHASWTLPSQHHADISQQDFTPFDLSQHTQNPINQESLHYQPTSSPEISRTTYPPANYLSSFPKPPGD